MLSGSTLRHVIPRSSLGPRQHDMALHRYSQPGVVDITPQRRLKGLEHLDASDLVHRGYVPGHRRGCHKSRQELSQRGPAHQFYDDPKVGRAESRGREEAPQHVGVPEGEGGPLEAADFGTQMGFQGVHESREKWLSLQRTPHAEGHPSAWHEHPRHFPEGRRPLGKVLQSLLREHDVKSGGGHRQSGSVPLLPRNRGPRWGWDGPRHGKHGLIHIHPNNLKRPAYLGGGRSGNNSCATGEVQDALARLKSGARD